eukprot:gene8714-660_t
MDADEIEEFREEQEQKIDLEIKQLKRFKTFSERIKSINVDVLHDSKNTFRITEQKGLEDRSSYFFENLKSCMELNKSEDFKKLNEELFPYQRSFNELYYNRIKIIEVLLKHLKKKKSMATDQILSLISILAKDLRTEFYPLLKTETKLFDTLIDLINPKLPEKTEAIFHCLAYLFKYLSKYIIEDLSFWYDKYSKIIGHHKWYIREFAAQSFAFLIQKLSNEKLKNYIDKIYEKLSERPNPNMFDGTSLLFFETMKGVYGNFHSTMPKILPILFRKLDWPKNIQSNDRQKIERENQRRFLLLEKCFKLLSKHMLNRNVSTTLWECVEKELKHVIEVWNKDPNFDTNIQLAHIILLMKCLIEKREIVIEKTLIQNLNIIISKDVLLSKNLSNFSLKSILDFINQVFSAYRGENLKLFLSKNEKENSYLDLIFQLKNYHLLTYFLNEIIDTLYNTNKTSIQKERNILSLKILEVSSKMITKSPESTLNFLINFVESDNVIISDSNMKLSESISNLLKQQFDLLTSSPNFDNFIGEPENEEIEIDNSKDEFKIPIIWGCLKCLDLLNHSNNAINSNLETIFNILKKKCAKIFDSKKKWSFNLEFVNILSQTVKTMSNLFDSKSLKNIFTSKILLVLLKNFGSFDVFLECIFKVLDIIKDEEEMKLHLSDVAPLLMSNLSSENPNLRLHTLELFSTLPGVLTQETNKKSKIIQNLLESERCAIVYQELRTKTNSIHRVIDELQRDGRNIDEVYISILSHYSIGGYFIKYSEIWSMINILAIQLSKINASCFWNIYAIYLNQWQKYYLTNEEIPEQHFLYKKRKLKSSVPAIKFDNYEQKKVEEKDEKILESLFMKRIKESYNHTDYKDYFPLLWGIIKDLTMGRHCFNDIFQNFKEFRELSNLSGAKLPDNSKITDMLKTYLKLFSNFDSRVLIDSNETLDIFMNLIITTNVEVQELVLSCINKYKLPWLQPYLADVKQIVGYHYKPSILKTFSLKNIDKEHRNEFVPFIIKILTPSVKPKKPTKKLSEKAKVSEFKKWKLGIKNLLIYFSDLKHDELLMFLESVIPTDLKIESKSSKFDSKLKWMLSIVEQLIMIVTDEYSFYYESVLDVLLKIALRDINDDYILQKEDLEEEEEDEVMVDQPQPKESEEEEEEEDIEEENQKDQEEKDEMEVEDTEKQDKVTTSRGIKGKSENMLHQEINHESIRLISLFLQRHPDHHFSKNHIDSIFNTTRFYFKHIKNNPTSLPKFFGISMSLIGRTTASFFISNFDILESLIDLTNKPKLSIQVFRSIINFLESLYEIKAEKFELNENIKKLIGKKKYQQIESKTIGDVLLKPLTNLIVVNFYHAIGLPKQKTSENKKNALKLIDYLKEYFDENTDANIIISLYAENIDKIKDPVLLQEAIELFKTYLPKATEETKVKYIRLFSNIFISHDDVEIRRGMCEIFERIFTSDSNKNVSTILFNLNALSKSYLDEIDFEKRFDTFKILIKMDKSIKSIPNLSMLPIVANLLFYLKDSQWIIRDNSTKSLESIVKHISKNEKDYLEVKNMILTFVRKHLLKTTTILSFVECISLLTILIKNYKEFEEFQIFCEFLSCLKNDSTQSKQNGISKLEKLIEMKTPRFENTDILLNMIFPILYSLMKLKENEEEYSIGLKSKEIILKISLVLKWKNLHSIILYFLNELSDEQSKKGPINKRFRVLSLQLICDIIQSFSKNRELHKDNHREIKSCLIKEIIPNLYSHLWKKQEGIITMRMDITLLIVKILKQYDPNELETQLSRIIADIISKLMAKKKKNQRELARDALIQIIQTLGSKYFFFALEKLSDLLRDGYQISILHFTINGMLHALKSENNTSSLDVSLDESTLDLLMDILLSDITKPLPEVSLNTVKEKSEYYNYNLTYNSFFVIGKIMNVENNINFVIQKIEDLMKNVTNVEVIERFKNLFLQLENGIKNNLKIKSQDEFISTFIKEKIEEKSIFRREFKQSDEGDSIFSIKKTYVDQMKETYEILPEPGRLGAISLNDTKRQELIAKNKNRNDYLIIHFYLRIFEHLVLKKFIKDKDFLDSFMIILCKLLKGQHTDVALDSLRILMLFHNLDLPTYKEKQNEIIDSLFEFMLNTGIDSKSEVWDTIFYSIRFFINQNVEFTEIQLKVLFDILKIEIIGTEFREQPFSLVAYLVSKGIIVPQVYDIAMKLRTILMISKSTIRNYSIDILTNFFLKYPMTPNVLQDHLNYLFKNVINESLPVDSKLNIISIISTIIQKFPTDFLNEKVEFILFPLIISLSSSDEDSKEQNLLEDTLFDFFKRISTKQFDKVLKLNLKWFCNEEEDDFNLVSIKMFSILSKVSNGEKLLNFVDEIFEILKRKIEPKNNDFNELIYSPRFNQIFNSLKIIKNLFEFKKLSSKKIDEIFDYFLQFLVYPSLNIRSISLEILINYFKNNKKITKNEETLKELSLVLIENYSSRNLNESISNLLTKLLLTILNKIENEKYLNEIFNEIKETSLFVEKEDKEIPIIILRRKSFLTLSIALLNQSKKKYLPYLKHLLILVHELIENKRTIIDDSLKKYVEQVSSAMKQILGFETFNNEFIQLTQEKFQENENRKAIKAQEAILDPVQFAQKKLEKNKKTKEEKKRKKREVGNEKQNVKKKKKIQKKQE